MNATWQSLIVTPLAQVDPWREMGRKFRENDTAFDPTYLLIVLSVVAAGVLVLWGISRVLTRDAQQPYHNPRRLFQQLCRGHQLGWQDRWLLWNLARAQQLHQPARLFVEPERFVAPQLPDELRSHTTRLEQLQRQLFGEPHCTPAASQ